MNHQKPCLRALLSGVILLMVICLGNCNGIEMKESSKKIEVVPYNPNWPKIFELGKAIILNALGNNCMESHHIGSTSVPGLATKPKIDIIAVV